MHYASVHCYWRLQCSFIWCLLFVLIRHGEEGATSLHAGLFGFYAIFEKKKNFLYFVALGLVPDGEHSVLKGTQRYRTPIQRNIKSNATSRLSRIFAKYMFNHKVNYALPSVLCRSRLEPTGQEMSYRIGGMLSMSMLSTMA